MKLASSYLLPARPDVVWAALNDPDVLRVTLPGCKALEQRDANHYEATLQIRVGPAAATFRGEVELTDLDPPRAYTIVGQGNAGPAGFAKISARVTLEPQDEATALHYDADVEIGGKLMSVGARLIQAAAAKNLEAFFGALRDQVAIRTGGAAADGGPAGTSADTSAGPSADTPIPTMAPRATAGASGTNSEVPAVLRRWTNWQIGLLTGSAGLIVGFIVGRFV